MLKVLKRFFLISFVLCVVMMLGGVGFCVYCLMDAPRGAELDATPKYYRSNVLDDTGNVVLTLVGQESNRVYVQLSGIPVDLQHAFVAIEDERFYLHNGVDLRGIGRAIYKGLTTGNLSQGASTITQQLIKNNVLTSWMEEKTFMDKAKRKVQEQFLALKLEKEVDKDWILENYLNTINLGGGNWGVETAARYYFDKDISQLTLSEGAVLAAITKNPTTYNPARNPEKNASRRELVLQKMVDLGYISEEQKAEALSDPVYDRIAEVRARGSSQEIMTYFEDALVRTLIEDLQGKGYSEEEAWNLLYRGGLTIYSTESTAIQEACEKAASDDELFDSDAQVSLVVMENENGYVKAIVGGRGQKEGSLLFNRATSSVRQPGSSIKILGEYAAAFESGLITLGTVVDDAPYTYSNGDSVVNSNGAFGGMTTVRSAIAKSNNIVALKCFQEVGLEQVWDQLEDFGLTTLTDADKVEALALGGTSGGVTNLEMTAAYCAIARGGSWIEPIYYTQVVDRSGNVILDNVQDTHEAVSFDTATLLTDAMHDVIQYGTGETADFSGMMLAGKSGTTTGIRDAWFVGFSPYYTCGVWGGYDDNSTQESSRYVQSIWRAVMQEANAPREYAAFPEPESYVNCRICVKCGKLAIDGVCDHTVQGDMTREERFLPGTQPLESCDCHVEVKVCTQSGELAGRYCPSTKSTVYLKEASEGTSDEDYVLPDRYVNAGDTCHTHTNIWQYWFGGGSGWGNDADNNGQGSYGGNGSNGQGSYGGNGSQGSYGNNGGNGQGSYGGNGSQGSYGSNGGNGQGSYGGNGSNGSNGQGSYGGNGSNGSNGNNSQGNSGNGWGGSNGSQGNSGNGWGNGGQGSYGGNGSQGNSGNGNNSGNGSNGQSGHSGGNGSGDSDTFNDYWQGIRRSVSSGWDDLVDGFNGVVDGLKDWWD